MTDEERLLFIEQIAIYVRKYAPVYGICVHSPIIAQACLESAYGTSHKAQYHNYFGLKYRGDRLDCHNGYFSDTSSEQNEDGTYTTVAVEDTDLDGIADRTTTIVFDKDLNVLSNDREHTYYALDKQIGNYKQGPTGDCWLLGSLSAIASTQIGKEAIAKSISQDKKGNFIINFEGANKQIKVTQKELIEARESELYSSGDSDVLLLEIAVEKALTPKKNIFQRIFGGKQEESPLHGGNLEDVTRLFFSKGTEVTHGYIDAFNFIDEQYILYNSNYFALATFTPNENGDVVTTDIDGNQVVLAKAPYSHGCAVVRADEDTVTIVNPWDSSKEITISRLNLVHNIDYFEYCQIF